MTAPSIPKCVFRNSYRCSYSRRWSPYHRNYYNHNRYRYHQHPSCYSYSTATVAQDIDRNPNRSSLYSSLFPTKREEHLDDYIDPNKETLIFDIDGTIADIDNRLNLSPGTKADGTRTRAEWNTVLSGENYKYDRVIPVAWAYLKYIESLNKYNIIYLSGRRSTTLKHSMRWMFKLNQYPKGFVIHRLTGVNGQQFKYKQLLKLNEKLNVVGYFGDRIIDDCVCAIKAGVRPILVCPNEWLFTKHIHGGMGTVMEEIIATNRKMMDKCKNDGKLYALQQLQNKNIPDAFVDIARNSKFWNMSYDDLIPAEFATELFDDQNKELLPPNVLSKIKEDAHYWTRVMEESNQILLPHQSEQEVKKFIEDSDDNLAQDEIEYVERQPLTKRRRLNRRRNSRKLARTVDMS
eukprot:512653_1